VPPENPQPPFDEEAALAELDKLRDDIQAARRTREQKVEEFETWMRDTRNTARVDRIIAIEHETGNEPAAAARAANRGSEPAAQASGLAAAPAAPSISKYAPLADDEYPFEAPRVRSFPPIDRRWLYYAGGLAVLVVIALLLGQTRGDNTAAAPPPAANAQTQPDQPPVAAPRTSAPAAQTDVPPAAPAPRKPIEIELTTTRPVWMRVTVDGEKRVEREVAANQRLAFGADKAIVLRAGDGGGVRLSVGGKDQGLLGKDGQIAVRTFTR
jgi:hypothetical protein